MDSREEEWFSWYLEELEQAGYLRWCMYQPTSFELSSPATLLGLSEQRTTKEVTVHLFKDHKYTADWRIEWNENAEGLFYWQTGRRYKGRFHSFSDKTRAEYIPFLVYNGMTYVDVKGGFIGRNNTSAVTFPLNQKWVYDKFDQIVQKVVISDDTKGLFYRTFTPKKVLESHVYKTDRSAPAGSSKLKYEPITLEQYAESKKFL